MLVKLVIWDLDETLLTGVLEEGDEDIDPSASWSMKQLDSRGILQALATQNPRSIIVEALRKFGWSDVFVQTEADLGPKADKVQRILHGVDIHPTHSVFVDNDPFERDAIVAQVPGLTAWSVAEVVSYLQEHTHEITAEAQRRPQMYRAQRMRVRDEETADNYLAFLHSCDIQVTIRPYQPEDATRVSELLTRTHRMNLGELAVQEAIRRLSQPETHRAVIAEMRDIYGDSGRCGILQMTSCGEGEGYIESLAISCRTQSRGLALAMLVGLMRHPAVRCERYRCRYIANDRNRPLRMALMSAGFKPISRSEELLLGAEQLLCAELPEWVKLSYS